MPLQVIAAQLSDKGIKEVNDDALVMHLPEGAGRRSQVMIAVIADGLSSAEEGGRGAVIATRTFASDFLATDLNWSIKTAGFKVVSAINRWLHGQGQHYNHRYSTHLTTFSAVVISGYSAHIFHVGDSRVWRFRQSQRSGQAALECLTKDHVIQIGESSQLIRALGMDWRVDVDYSQIDVQVGDYFLLTTDGVHGVLSDDEITNLIQTHVASNQASNEEESQSIEQCVQAMMKAASDAKSKDNLSCQLIHIKELDLASDKPPQLSSFPPLLPDTLLAGQQVDGFEIVSEIHANSRSKIYRATQLSDQRQVVLKSPAAQFTDDVEALHAFMQEEWIGQRINHPDIVTTLSPEQPRQFLYLVQEYLEGQTLREWRKKNPEAPVETVIQFVRPAVRALRALHRREILHQDVKPDNFIVLHDSQDELPNKIPSHARLKLIDFGSAQTGSVTDTRTRPGAMEYAAPEYALDEPVSAKSDQFALAVTFYEMLTGKMPYGENYVYARKPSDFADLDYVPASSYNPHVPTWMDAALMRACSLNPEHRYEDLGEWQADLERPNYNLTRPKMPLIEKHPVKFWQTVAALLLLGNIFWFVVWFK
ncbi:MAG: bifunctional protein-serine/threonine kinase/phosphatase [Aquirhabdus sp.]